jgi:hypothetical protein
LVTTQITRRKNQDTTETLRKHSDGSTLPYSEANLTTMLSGETDQVFVLQRIDANNNRYPFTLQAGDQTEFTGDFETSGICCYQIKMERLNSKWNFDLIIEKSMIGNQN